MSEKTSKTPRFASFLLAFSMFATGASGLVYEYILSTVSTYILGNSIEQFSIIIALMMFMMGFAGWVQKFMSDSRLIEKFVILEAILSILGGFAPIAIYGAFGFAEHNFQLIQYFFVTSIGFLIGFEIPLILRINEKYSKTLGINISRILSADYIGSFIGAVIWTFYLIKNFPLTEISFIMAGFNFLVAVFTFFYFWKHNLVTHKILPIILIISTAFLITAGYSQNRGWSILLEQRLYEDKIVFSKTTKYQRLVMTNNKKLDEYRFYINGNLQFSSLDEYIYHEQLVHPAMSVAENRKHILILGGGDGMALREVLKYGDAEKITLVDLDRDMTDFCSKNSIMRQLNKDSFKDARVNLLNSSGISGKGIEMLYQRKEEFSSSRNEKPEKTASVQIINIDADLFISNFAKNGESEIFDVIIVDLPDPNSVELAKLYSREFYSKLRFVLKEDGVISVQATSPYHAKKSYLCIKKTMESAGFRVISYHDNVPSFGEWGWFLGFSETFPKEKINEKISKLTIKKETKYLTGEKFRAATVFGKNWLEAPEIEVNSLMQPVILRYYLDESWLVE